MAGEHDITIEPADQRDSKRAGIHNAAIKEFSARGLSATSMANIAEAAGMSRPALYQYFRNKRDIFASAFVALFEERVSAALAALVRPGTTGDQLNGLLQRYDGDLWELMAASPHSDEIVSTKGDFVESAVAEVVQRLWTGVANHLEVIAPSAGASGRAAWVEVLSLSPKGFKSDRPSVETFRGRLTTLADSVAAAIDAA